ncbi:MAG: hypothetical protein OQK68_08445 [Sedimenticola sp.]|nr:hypothetical protein [Sedimenticola sp.]
MGKDIVRRDHKRVDVPGMYRNNRMVRPVADCIAKDNTLALHIAGSLVVPESAASSDVAVGH